MRLPLVSTCGLLRCLWTLSVVCVTGGLRAAGDDAVPVRHEPELWLGPLAALLRGGAPGAGTTTADLPGWARASIWTTAAGDGEKADDYGFRDGDLFGLVR